MKKIIPFVVLCILSYFAVRPLFSSGYFPMHDDTQVARVIEMGRALKDGQFPVRWVSDLGYGYGYPIYNFYAPLPYYFGGVLYALGVPALTSTKIMFGIGVVLPALVLYAVMASIASWPVAVTAAVLYMYAPYHAVQVYVRGAVGEYWILLFWPLIFSALLQKKSFLGAIGLAGSILSHTLLGYATVLFLSLGFVVSRRLPRWFMVGLGLSAFFWLPALVEMRYTSVAAQIGSTANYRDHFVCLAQVWSSPWGYGGSAPGCIADGMSFMLGKVHIILAIIALFFMTPYPRIGVLIFGIGIMLTSSFFEPLWRILPGFAYMQYPWRFLSVGSFGLSLLGAYVVTIAKQAWSRAMIAGVIIAGVLVMNIKWFAPQFTYETDGSSFEALQDLTWRVSRISDEYLPKDLRRPMRESDIVSATIRSDQPIKVVVLVSRVTEKEYVVESTAAARLTINIANFPGWLYKVNGHDVLPTIVSGLPQLSVNPGRSIIHARFTDTPVRTVGNIVSGITLLVFIFGYVTKKKTNG